jgi:RNA polymerase sigma-70 factor (ECF subfamily)
LISENTIEELKNGNEKAFDAIIEQYQTNVYNTCLGFVQNEKDAEELTQDVFIKLYQKISSFKGESAFSTWLYRISVNACLVFEREKKAKKRFAIFGNLFGGSSNEPEPAEFNHPGVVLEKNTDACNTETARKPENGNPFKKHGRAFAAGNCSRNEQQYRRCGIVAATGKTKLKKGN